jgi:hypothetical protein
MLRFACLFVLTIALPASADDPAVNGKQVAGLFLQSCVQFAANKVGLRDWAKVNGLREVPAQAKQLFLNGQSGIVYDATNQVGKFVLVSWDSGTCATVAEHASGAAIASNLEQDMREAQISFKMTVDSDDAEEKSLHRREYLASLGAHEWRVIVGTVRDPAGGQAILTLNPN